MASAKELEQITAEQPAKVPNQPQPSAPGKKQEQIILENLNKIVDRSQDGEKHGELVKAAFVAGGYIAGGCINEGDAVCALETAISNKSNVADLKAAYRTIQDGIKQGKSKPLYKLENLKPYTNGSGNKQADPQPKQRKTRIRTFNQVKNDAQNEPEIIPLIPGFWNRGEVAIFAGDAGSGKSLYSVSEAAKIAQDHKILYYDFELSDRQIEKRYLNKTFNDNLLRVDYDPEALDYTFNFEDIEQDLQATGAKIIIIDNITALSLKNTVDPDAALKVLRGLKMLQIKHRVSSLVLAHTPKIAPNTPLTMNHLAGSKHLSNFADSIFFIGRSTQGKEIRYLKQVKNRSDEDSRVFTISIEDQDGFLTYQFINYCDERDHLQEIAPNPNDELKQTVLELRNNGESYSQIEAALYKNFGRKVSRTTIGKWINGS